MQDVHFNSLLLEKKEGSKSTPNHRMSGINKKWSKRPVMHLLFINLAVRCASPTCPVTLLLSE